MSKQQLVEEYVQGRLIRKAFVRKLAALGVSVASAITYADRLAMDFDEKLLTADKSGQVDPGDSPSSDPAANPDLAPNFYPA